MGPNAATFRARILFSGMLTFRQFVWFSGCLIEVAILARSIQCKSFGKYSLFYAYIISLFGVSFFVRVAGIAGASYLIRLFLPLEFITCVLCCGVTLEIIRHVFAEHASLERSARRAAVVVFGMIFLELAILAALRPHWSAADYVAHVAMDLQLAQAAGLTAILFLIGRYGIEVGRNMRGIILGFGVYLGASLILVPLRQLLGMQFYPAWRITQMSAFLAALCIWAVALWTYEPETGEMNGPTAE
jgi:hypothetical protein